MKKIKTKEKSGDKAQEGALRELAKKPGKNPLVKVKTKKSKRFTFPNLGEYWNRTVQFIKDSWNELKKVTWPSQKETLGATAVVLALVILVSAYLGFVDMLLSRVTKLIIG